MRIGASFVDAPPPDAGASPKKPRRPPLGSATGLVLRRTEPLARSSARAHASARARQAADDAAAEREGRERELAASRAAVRAREKRRRTRDQLR